MTILLTLCPLIAKTYRISKIFQSHLHIHKIYDQDLFLIMFLFQIPGLILLVVQLTVGNVNTDFIMVEPLRPKYGYHECSIMLATTIAGLCLLAIYCMIAIYYAYKVRQAYSLFNESKQISTSVVFFVMMIFITSVYQLFGDTDVLTLFSVRSFCIYIALTSMIVVLMWDHFPLLLCRREGITLVAGTRVSSDITKYNTHPEERKVTPIPIIS